MNQESIDRFNHFISKTKCSISIAQAAGFAVAVGSGWNLEIQKQDPNHQGKFAINKSYLALPIGHQSKRLSPLSMLLVGKAVYPHGNKYAQVEVLFGLKAGVVSDNFSGGLIGSRDSRDNAIYSGKHNVLGYNIGLYFRNKLRNECTEYIDRIPDGIILDG